MKAGADISCDVPDWTRENRRFGTWAPSRALLQSIRNYQAVEGGGSPLAWLRRRYNAARHRFWSVITGADIPLNCRIDGGLLLPHPNGVVIHPAATVGPNCLIFQQVTIGAGGKPGFPRIGGHVDIGAGAKVLGGVTVGNHARIGANAVVTSDVPPYATAVGIPARVIALRESGD